VILPDLTPSAAAQSGLFDAPNDAHSIAPMRAINRLNGRFGLGTIAGTASERRVWALRPKFIPPRYTIAWDELLRV
jgi:hypothetical protein